ncbi:Plasmid stable inheritance protein K (plasmid) [Xanthomonas citri subsp. citri Aw12879]|nr:Plasmid stable inheritance protein K [Xanthomonas citri subsp. citri Aw12879]
MSDTVKPAVRAKLPPLVIGSTTGVFVRRLNALGDTISTGRVPCCSWPDVGSSETK